MIGPSSDGSDKWNTLRPPFRILVIARTNTSAMRVVDTLAVFRNDHRIELFYAFDDTSANNAGVVDYFEKLGANFMPWENVGEHPFHLALSASENVRFGDLHKETPIVVVPHGGGFHKTVPSSHGDGDHIAGLVDPELMKTQDIILGVPHPGQAARINKQAPETIGRTALIGDPCVDRMILSRSLRDAYRAELGVHENQTLIVVNSTWGRQSTYGRFPKIAENLLRALPLDQYRVALILHPNIWARHHRSNIENWNWDARTSGLILVDPINSWQATLIAADVVLADHGSISHYSAELGKPILLAPASDETVPNTPASEFARQAHQFDPSGDPAKQIETVLADHHRIVENSRLMEGIFDARGNSFELMRDLFYSIIGTSPLDDRIRLTTVDMPRSAQQAVTAVQVACEPRLGGLVMRRYPADLDPCPESESSELDHFEFRAARTDTPNQRWLENVEVVLHPGPSSKRRATSRATELFKRNPRLSLAGCEIDNGRCLVQFADGRQAIISAPDRHESSATDPFALACVAYAVERYGMLDQQEICVQCGNETVTVTVHTADTDPSHSAGA